MQYMSSTVD